MTAGVCRWGILGTATIARKNWQSIWNAENSTLAAVASRDADRSAKYIAECQAHVPFDPAPEALGSYEALLARDDIDAVYIPLPTMVRKPWVIRAAEAGKHVMCEKPCAETAADVEEMLDVCQQNNVQFMDGVMFMHTERLERLQAHVQNGEIGEVRRIASQFSFAAPPEWLSENIRTSSQLEPQGCLGDLGWYTIRISLAAMNWQMPRAVIGRILQQANRSDSPTAVPIEFAGDLLFDDGVSAGFYCSFVTNHQQWVHVCGSQGAIYADDFVLPDYGNELVFDIIKPRFDLTGCDFRMARHTTRVASAEYSDSHPTAQETKLFRNFAELALSGKPDPRWGEMALATQRVLDACLESGHQDSKPIELV